MALSTGIRAACIFVEFPPKFITMHRHGQLSPVCSLEGPPLKPVVGHRARGRQGPHLEGPLC